jgi:alpha-1,3-glucosyltransferase
VTALSTFRWLPDSFFFQYNCISLGLTLGAIAGVLSRNELVAAALFSLAINHKQVCLLNGKLYTMGPWPIHKLCYHYM